MPWTMEDPPPAVGDDWTDEEIEACVSAANAVLADGGTDEEAIFACIAAAGKGERGAKVGIASEATPPRNDKGGVERRVIPAEVRVLRQAQDAEGAEGPARIEGYAAVFEAESMDLGGFREVIHAGAFTRSLADGADVRGLINHDPSLVLGRTKAGTLRLAEDDYGLRFVLHPPDTAAARDLLVSMKRGDVDQMSFGFEAVRDQWEADERGALRHLLEARLYDVSVVTFPAYPQTSAEARAMAGTLTPALSQRERGQDDGDPEDGVGDTGLGDGGVATTATQSRNKLQGRLSLARARLEIVKRV